jgi:hypothetical protein
MGPPQKHSAGYESLGLVASHPRRVACEAYRYEVVSLNTNRLMKPKENTFDILSFLGISPFLNCLKHDSYDIR